MVILSRPVHKVFINFRGKDIRHGFVSHLKDALKRHNIDFFMDTFEQRGRDLKHLFKRIEEAKIALVILSARYAESKWCLEELTTIMDQSEKRKMIVIPIFYKVRPEDVDQQTGVFGHKFRNRDEGSCPKENEKWQVALKAVCNKIGLTLDRNTSEAEFTNKVVKAVEEVLITIKSDEAKEGNCVENLKTFVMALLLSWFGSAFELIGAVLGLLTETGQSDKGREYDRVKKVKKTFSIPLALPLLWFGSGVELIGAVLDLLTETAHKCASASPAMAILASKAGSLVAISSR